MFNSCLRLAALLALAILALSAAVVVAFSKQQGWQFYEVPDNRLAPALVKGDLAIVSPMQPPRTGDFLAIADYSQSSGAAFRDYKADEVGLRLGTVVKALPLAGYGLRAVRQPLGLALLVYTPASVVAAGETRRLKSVFGKYQIAQPLTPPPRLSFFNQK